MADVEIIFPDKVVGIKPFQLVQLIVTVVTALVTGALVLWKVCVCVGQAPSAVVVTGFFALGDEVLLSACICRERCMPVL